MRERENKRKANLKKKEEREQKERETRARMNIPTLTKGFYVGPSQIKLSGFLNTGIKRKREVKESEKVNREDMELGKENREDMEPGKGEKEPKKDNSKEKELDATKSEDVVQTTKKTSKQQEPKPQTTASVDPPLPPMAPPKSRAPLQPRSTNPIIRPKPLFFAEPSKPSIPVDDNWDLFLASNTQIERELASPDTRSNRSITAPPPARPCIAPIYDDTDLLDMISTQDLDYTEDNAPAEPEQYEYLVGQLDSKDWVKKESSNDYNIEDTSINKVEFKEEPRREVESSPESDYGDDIDYESAPEEEHLRPSHPPEDPTFRNLQSNPSHNNTIPPIKSNPKPKDSDFDDGIKDSELSDLLAGCETESTNPTPPTEPFTQSPQDNAVFESFDYGEFELSTQEMRELSG